MTNTFGGPLVPTNRRHRCFAAAQHDTSAAVNSMQPGVVQW